MSYDRTLSAADRNVAECQEATLQRLARIHPKTDKLALLPFHTSPPGTLQYPVPPDRAIGRHQADRVVPHIVHGNQIERAFSRSTNFWILPVAVVGNGPNITVFGALKCAK